MTHTQRVHHSMTVKTDAAKAADRILNEIWADLVGDSDVIPVDPVLICHSLGIDVFDAELPPTVSGSITKRYNQDPVILLNKRDSDNRKRFTCAHELGHYVERSDDPGSYEYIDRRDEVAASGRDPHEVFANEFAACLLMPKPQVERLRRRGLNGVALAWQFRVSEEAMKYRLDNLGLMVA